MTIRLDGQVAIVTGAGHGLGHSHAKLLAERGAKVAPNPTPAGGVEVLGVTRFHALHDHACAEIAPQQAGLSQGH